MMLVFTVRGVRGEHGETSHHNGLQGEVKTKHACGSGGALMLGRCSGKVSEAITLQSKKDLWCSAETEHERWAEHSPDGRCCGIVIWFCRFL